MITNTLLTWRLWILFLSVSLIGLISYRDLDYSHFWFCYPIDTLHHHIGLVTISVVYIWIQRLVVGVKVLILFFFLFLPTPKNTSKTPRPPFAPSIEGSHFPTEKSKRLFFWNEDALSSVLGYLCPG